MSRHQRLERLEGAVPRAGDENPLAFCLKCAGPGGFRRMIDYVRAQRAAGEKEEPVLICRGCGGPSVNGHISRERTRNGFA